MDSILQALSSPVWWLTVVLAGFAVNIIAAYSKPFLDKLLSSVSKRYKIWSADRKQRIGNVSFYLLHHPEEASDLRGQVVHLTLKMVLAIAFALFFVQAVDFLAATTEVGFQTYVWLKIAIYLGFTLFVIAQFQRYILLATILKDYDKSVYSAADRYRLKKYE